MPQDAQAFLAIWHDIDPAYEPEWHRWHSFEHMPERVGILGFLAGRRYMSPSARNHTCFTLYEGQDLAVFNSPAYLARLNAPTEWTRRMAPAFQNFMRGACLCTAASGAGVGGAALTLRYSRDGGADAPAIDTARLFAAAKEIGFVVRTRVGICQHHITEVDTNERAMRSATGETRYDAVILIEGFDRPSLEAAKADLVSAAGQSVSNLVCDAAEVYDLAFLLSE